MKSKMLILLLLFAISCVEGEKESGYNCDNGQCVATFENPTYLTLQDCQSVCGSTGNNTPEVPKTGTVKISLNWQYSYSSGSTLIGLGYSSTDIANNAFFVSKTYYVPDTFSQSNLAPAIYYYKAKRTFTANDGQGPYTKVVEKSGSFTIKSAQVTQISVNLN